jgi:hypothetical protein
MFKGLRKMVPMCIVNRRQEGSIYILFILHHAGQEGPKVQRNQSGSFHGGLTAKLFLCTEISDNLLFYLIALLTVWQAKL